MDEPKKLLALDISSSCTGWASFYGKDLVFSGQILRSPVPKELIYPWDVDFIAKDMAKQIHDIMFTTIPDTIVVEAINQGSNRRSQQLLEHVHCKFWSHPSFISKTELVYVNTSAWRSTLKISKKQQNTKTVKEACRVWLKTNGYGEFRPKDTDRAEAIAIGLAYLKGCKRVSL